MELERNIFQQLLLSCRAPYYSYRLQRAVSNLPYLIGVPRELEKYLGAEMDEHTESQQFEGSEETPHEPPVLPVSSSYSSTGEQSSTSTTATATSTAVTQPAPPAPHQPPAESSGAAGGEHGEEESVRNLWGLSEKIDTWQVSSLPEQKQYFALDVSAEMGGNLL